MSATRGRLEAGWGPGEGHGGGGWQQKRGGAGHRGRRRVFGRPFGCLGGGGLGWWLYEGKKNAVGAGPGTLGDFDFILVSVL